MSEPATLSTCSSPTLRAPRPAVATARSASRATYGPAVGALARAMGRPLMPWQQFVADVALEIEADGRFAYQLVLVTVPRQSGKTTLFGAVLDHRAIVTRAARCWYTMQTQKDAVDWLTNEHWPLLAPFGDLVTLRRMAGSENVRWVRSGGLVRPFPPNPAGLHGKVSDLVVVDECWAFDYVRGVQLDQAIVPTQATRPNAQVWKVSTAGDAGATWWLGSVEAGRAAAAAGRTDGVAYFEWSCGDLDPTDEASWAAYHPAYDRTVGAPAMRAALELLGPDEFGRAYGNRWTSQVARVIPLAAWRAAADDGLPLPEAGNVALGFDVAVDRSDAAVVAAWREPVSSSARLEVAASEPGVGWVADRIVELVDRWRPRAVFYDAAGPALDVADVLERRGVELVGMKAREYAAACAGLYDALVADPPAVAIRPHADLDAAAAAAARRTLGDAWAWGRRQSSTSIATLTAATVALWAYDHAASDLGVFRVW
jgi:hypothetical protein